MRGARLAWTRHVDPLLDDEGEPAEYPADRLAKLPAEYCVAGDGSGKPQSHAGARRSAAEAKRWMTVAASLADKAMNKNTRSPL